MFIVVAALAIIFIKEIFEKWIEQPMIISVSPTPTLMSGIYITYFSATFQLEMTVLFTIVSNVIKYSELDIPFPAVTICDINRVRKSAIMDLNPSDHGIAHIMCMGTAEENEILSNSTSWPEFKRVLLKVRQIVYRFGRSVDVLSNFFRSPNHAIK